MLSLERTHPMKHLIKITLALFLVAGSCGCATDHRSASNNTKVNNLEEASRDNHNALLPASFYDSNHEIDD